MSSKKTDWQLVRKRSEDKNTAEKQRMQSPRLIERVLTENYRSIKWYQAIFEPWCNFHIDKKTEKWSMHSPSLIISLPIEHTHRDLLHEYWRVNKSIRTQRELRHDFQSTSKTDNCNLITILISQDWNLTWLSIHFNPTAAVHSFFEALVSQSRL